ncbi:DUF2142 domain-containing protein [Candidatus Saccharibacteria bacterium]|nr:DUF2142 domain-containing protein [Candidatus Saccharibacteria bacterium]
MVNPKQSPKPTATSGNNRLTTFIKANYKSILLFIGLSLFNIFFLCWSFKSNNLPLDHSFIIILITSLFFEIALCFVLFIAKRKTWKIEKIFFILGSILGLLYLFAIPIGRAPDEESHFFRVYEIASGHIISDISEQGDVGSLEPQDIEIVRTISKDNITYSDLLSNVNDQADEDSVFVTTSADSYNIISYLPQVTGMFIGKTIGLPYLIAAYLARFFNLICCLLILYYSIKHIPFLKEIVFFIALLPINMQAMVSLSPDALITASAIALITFTLYSNYTLKTPFTKKHFFILLPLCILVSITKIVYAPLCLLLFTIPKARFGNTKRKLFWIIGLGMLVIAVYFAWRLIAPPIRNSTDTGSQLANIMHNPFYYLAVLVHSISTNSILYLTGTLGGHLEWFNVNLSMLYILASLIIFTLLCAKARQSITISKSIKILSISLFAFITIIIFTALYLSWTKVGETVIDGVQGRYFLPILLLVPLAFLSVSRKSKNNRPRPSSLSQNYYLYAFFIFESIYAISTIVCTHI